MLSRVRIWWGTSLSSGARPFGARMLADHFTWAVQFPFLVVVFLGSAAAFAGSRQLTESLSPAVLSYVNVAAYALVSVIIGLSIAVQKGHSETPYAFVSVYGFTPSNVPVRLALGLNDVFTFGILHDTVFRIRVALSLGAIPAPTTVV